MFTANSYSHTANKNTDTSGIQLDAERTNGISSSLSMETEEVIKLVDNIYKNILDKFNPGARQLISAGKAYLKALHGTAAASRVFNEALAKIAVNAQQGGTNDIGSALMNIVGVYKDIQDQHMNILKAFYVDLLVPLETNLEKDTKVVQFEQKKFLQQHKIRADSYSKATATMKKQRKKKGNAQNADKEIKSMQAVDEEKNKLDAFCEQSLKNAMTQERRRYGFVLERQCSLAKHWIAYHSAGKNFILNNLDNWEEVSASREFLPPNMENVFARQMIMDMNNENDMDDDSDRGSVISAIRKTRSIDASCLDMRSIGDVVNSVATHMPRAKSEFNLTSSSSAAIEAPKWDQRTVSRGLYAYLSSGENQLSFLEGDRIALVGDRAKGWQFGENLRTHTFGWFPVAYTELELEDSNHNNWGASRNGHGGHQSAGSHHSQQPLQQQQQQQQQHHHQQHEQHHHQQQQQQHHHQHLQSASHGAQQRSHSSDHHQSQNTPDSSLESTVIDEPLPLPAQLQQAYHEDASPTRMFGDTIMYRQSKQFRRVSGGVSVASAQGPKPGPPPTLPAPVPTPVVPASYPSSSSASAKSQLSQMSQSQSFMMTNGGGGGGGGGGSASQLSNAEKRKSMPAGVNYGKQVSAVAKPKARNGVAVNNASLHSSNDSGFANEPAPPQPDIDYSDDETVTRVPIRSSHHVTRSPSNVNATATAKKSSRIPTRRANDSDTVAVSSSVAKSQQAKSSSTLTRPSKANANGIRPSSSYGNLALEEQQQQLQQQDTEFVYRTIDRKATNGNGNIIKRTKSFWKFGKGDDILEGMAMWRHRDLVPADGELDRDEDSPQPVAESTLRRPQRTATVAPAAVSGQQQKSRTLTSAHSTETLTNNNNNNMNGDQEMGDYLVQNGMVVDGNAGGKYHFTKSEIDSRISAMQQTTMQQQQQRTHVIDDRQHHVHQSQAQANHRASVAYETAPEEEEESIYDVQPKTRQMANMNVMSRDKVIRQAYLENEREMQSLAHQQAQRQSVHQSDKNRSSRTDKNNAYNASSGQPKPSQSMPAANSAAPTGAATAASKKKKKTTNATKSAAAQQPAAPIEYYTRAETPDTIHHDGIFDDDDLMNDNAVRMRDTDFYDDESADDVAIMMKTVKRQDILKQYYNSSDGGTDDTEQNSTSSDAYDCIVVEDHHVPVQRRGQQSAGGGNAGGSAMMMDGPTSKGGKMEFKTFRGGSDDKDSGMESSRPGTLLPRTKLAKTNSGGNGGGQPIANAVAAGAQNGNGGKGEKGAKRSRGGDRPAAADQRAERTERSERSERKERSDRGERVERGERHERDEQRRDRTVDRSERGQQQMQQQQQQQQMEQQHQQQHPHRDHRDQRNEAANDKYYRSSDLESTPSVKSYGPWYDLWGKDVTVHK